MSRYSIIPSRAIEDELLTPMDLKVLLALGTYTDDDGWCCYPSIDTLAEKIHVSRSTIKRALQDLKKYGYIEVTPAYRKDGSQTSNKYKVLADIERERKRIDNEEISGVTDDLPPVHQRTPPGSSANLPRFIMDGPPKNDPINDTVDDDCKRAQAEIGKIYGWLEKFFSLAIPPPSSPISAWLTWGADFDLDIKPVVERWKKKNPTRVPRSFSWFNEAIANAIMQRNQSMPIIEVNNEKNQRITTSERGRNGDTTMRKSTGVDAFWSACIAIDAEQNGH